MIPTTLHRGTHSPPRHKNTYQHAFIQTSCFPMPDYHYLTPSPPTLNRSGQTSQKRTEERKEGPYPSREDFTLKMLAKSPLPVTPNYRVKSPFSHSLLVSHWKTKMPKELKEVQILYIILFYCIRPHRTRLEAVIGVNI